MIRVQEIIHSLEEGQWAKRIRGLVLLLLIGSLGLVYYLNLTRNFTAPEAMDAAQLARNIAEGRGYTTQFIRPRSEEHTSELQSRTNLVCRLLLEKKKKTNI